MLLEDFLKGMPPAFSPVLLQLRVQEDFATLSVLNTGQYDPSYVTIPPGNRSI